MKNITKSMKFAKHWPSRSVAYTERIWCFQFLRIVIFMNKWCLTLMQFEVRGWFLIAKKHAKMMTFRQHAKSRFVLYKQWFSKVLGAQKSSKMIRKTYEFLKKNHSEKSWDFEWFLIKSIRLRAACAEPGKGLVIADFVCSFNTLRTLRGRRI